MRHLWKRVRGALMMGVLWGAAGALGGFAIEMILNILPGPDDWLGVDIWPAVLAIPSFVGGVLFSVLVSIAERRRRFEELSFPRFGLWGAITGAVIGFLLGLPVVLLAPMALVGGASAATSLALARKATKRESIRAGADSET